LECWIGCLLCIIGKNSCFPLIEYLRSAGFVAPIQGNKNCLIFDENIFNGDDLEDYDQVSNFCGVSYSVSYSIHVLCSLSPFLLFHYVYNVRDFHDDNRVGIPFFTIKI